MQERFFFFISVFCGHFSGNFASKMVFFYLLAILGVSGYCNLWVAWQKFRLFSACMAASHLELPESKSNISGQCDVVPLDITEIIVIRHGETEWNTTGKIQGHLDIELNDIGRQQAVALADRLSKEYTISAVYSSDLKRASETAQIIAKSCLVPDVILDPMLRERNLGDLQGLVFRELSVLNPKSYKAFTSRRTDQEIPGGGESLDQLYRRCTSCLERIAAKHRGERVLVVTHGGTTQALYSRATSGKSMPGKVLNTSINIFHLSDDKWMIKKWGDVSHLNKTGFLQSGFGGDRKSG